MKNTSFDNKSLLCAKTSNFNVLFFKNGDKK